MAKTAQLQKEENIIVSITKENKIFLNEHQIGIDKLKGALEEKLVTKQNKTVILKADEKIDLGLAVKVMDIAKSAIKNQENAVIVVSAFSGVTDQLIKIGSLAAKGNNVYKQTLQEIRAKHLEAAPG